MTLTKIPSPPKLFRLNLFIAAFTLPCGYFPITLYVTALLQLNAAPLPRWLLLTTPIFTILIYALYTVFPSKQKKHTLLVQAAFVCLVLITLVAAFFTTKSTLSTLIIGMPISFVQHVVIRGGTNCIGLALIFYCHDKWRWNKLSVPQNDIRDIKTHRARNISCFLCLMCGTAFLLSSFFSGVINFSFLLIMLVLATPAIWILWKK